MECSVLVNRVWLFSLLCDSVLDVIILSEVSQKEKDVYHNITYIWNIKNSANKLLQNRNRLTDMENKLMVTKGERNGGGINEGFGISRFKLFYIQQVNNKLLLYSMENHIL